MGISFHIHVVFFCTFVVKNCYICGNLFLHMRLAIYTFVVDFHIYSDQWVSEWSEWSEWVEILHHVGIYSGTFRWKEIIVVLYTWAQFLLWGVDLEGLARGPTLQQDVPFGQWLYGLRSSLPRSPAQTLRSQGSRCHLHPAWPKDRQTSAMTHRDAALRV